MHVIDLGITDFVKAREFQLELVKKVALGVSSDTLIITEHEPVITIGRVGSEDNILRPGIKTVYTDRGGDVTYHGPGQLVAYPIFRLENEGRDIHNFLDFLEEAGNHFLSQYGLRGEKNPGLRGIWAEGKKIGSIGIGVKKWVTYHGMAVNINNDLAPFSFIRPCGLSDVKITSLKELLRREIDINDAKDKIICSFKEVPLLADSISKA